MKDTHIIIYLYMDGKSLVRDQDGLLGGTPGQHLFLFTYVHNYMRSVIHQIVNID